MHTDPIVEFTGKLPLGGRYPVGLLVENAARARMRGDRTTQQLNSGLIASFSAVHGVQAAMGATSLVQTLRGTAQQKALRATVCGVYTTLNGMAAYAQAKVAYQAATSGTALRPLKVVENRPRFRLFGKSSYSPEQTLFDSLVSVGINAAYSAAVYKEL